MMAYFGTRGVLRGTGYLTPVVIQGIRFEDNKDGHYVFIELKGIGGGSVFSMGRQPLSDVAFEVGSAWNYFSINPDSWSVSMSGMCWKIMLDEAACDAVVRLCKDSPDMSPFWFFKLADFVCRNPSKTEAHAQLAELYRHTGTGRIREGLRARLKAKG